MQKDKIITRSETYHAKIISNTDFDIWEELRTWDQSTKLMNEMAYDTNTLWNILISEMCQIWNYPSGNIKSVIIYKLSLSQENDTWEENID